MSRLGVSVGGIYILDIQGWRVTTTPEGGNVDFIDEIRQTVAGNAGGTAINLAKFGVTRQAVGAVESDEKTDFVIDCRNMARLASAETSATIQNAGLNGEQPALHCQSASDPFEFPDDMVPGVLDCRVFHLGAYDIDFVDTTVCDDAYAAGSIAGLADHRSLEECALLGTASASLMARGLGFDVGITGYAQVEAEVPRWRV